MREKGIIDVLLIFFLLKFSVEYEVSTVHHLSGIISHNFRVEETDHRHRPFN